MSAKTKINFEYKGDDYELSPSDFFELGEQIEEFVEFDRVISGEYKIHKLIRAFKVVLDHVGKRESLQDIKESFFNDSNCSAMITNVIVGILVPIVIPPESVSKHNSKKPKTKRKAVKK